MHLFLIVVTCTNQFLCDSHQQLDNGWQLLTRCYYIIEENYLEKLQVGETWNAFLCFFHTADHDSVMDFTAEFFNGV